MSESVLAALAALPGMSSRRLAHLLDGRTVAEAWVLVLAGNASPPVVPKEHSARWASQLARIELDEISARLAKLKCRVTSWHDDDHPRRFRDDIDPAPVLFRCGELPGPTTPTVGIVGTRRCSGAGKEIAYELGASLSEAGVSVVSGLALGVDGAAHRGAVAAGGARPVAVVGSGIDVVYPARHRELWERSPQRAVSAPKHRSEPNRNPGGSRHGTGSSQQFQTSLWLSSPGLLAGAC